MWIIITAWISNLAFTVSAIPQLYRTIKNGNANGLSIGFLILWLIGECLSLPSVLQQCMIPFILSYAINAIIVSIILGYKIRDKMRK